MTFNTLTEEEEKELYRLYRLYYREARKCENAGAYLAGCIILGSALETILVLMVNIYPEEAAQTRQIPQRRKKPKALRDWTFAELIHVVKAVGWLPAGLDVREDDWDTRRARIGDYAEIVRMVRNLVHPARFMADHPRGRVTRNRLEWQFEIVDLCREWITVHVNERLRREFEAEGLL